MTYIHARECGTVVMQTILILGSGPNVLESRAWPRGSFERIVAINNAWAVRSDWDDLIFPDDFATARLPKDLSHDQRFVRASEYVAVQNEFGGFVYAGGTMAFTASYWALGTYRPKVIAIFGCDMIYDQAQTHFYGNGAADPLRADKTLRNLEAKSARLQILAARAGCAMVNLSTAKSRLTFPRSTPAQYAACEPVQFDETVVAAALQKEKDLNYQIPSGKYWKEEDRFDTDAIDALDALWLKALRQT